MYLRHYKSLGEDQSQLLNFQKLLVHQMFLESPQMSFAFLVLGTISTVYTFLLVNSKKIESVAVFTHKCNAYPPPYTKIFFGIC